MGNRNIIKSNLLTQLVGVVGWGGMLIAEINYYYYYQ